MAPYQFTVTYQATWRGAVEQFASVFHYDTPPASTQSDADLETILDSLIATIRPQLAETITIVKGQVNGPTDQGAAADIMRVVKDVSFVGTNSVGAFLPLEECFVVSWYVGRSARGYKRFLRKYFRLGRAQGDSQGSAGALGNGPLAAASITPVKAMANSLKNLQNGTENWPICTPQGDHLPLNTDAQVLPHLHTRQMRRGRRRSSSGVTGA